MAAARIAAPRLAAAVAAPRPATAHRLAPVRPPVQLAVRSVVVAAATSGDSSSGGYQRPLSNQERKAKRAEAQRLGRQLCLVNLGQKGLTPSFIEGFRLALAANELVKVKVGACDEAEEDIIEALSAAGDCVLVHKIGFTLTFFRDQSLPPQPPYRPRPRAAAAAPAVGSQGESEGEGEGASDVDDEIDEELAAYLMSEDAFSDSDSEGESEEEEEEDAGPPNSARRQAAAARAARSKRRPPPPEFTVIS